MEIRKIVICLVLFIMIILVHNSSQAMSHYQIVGTSTGLVTASALNVREGPGTKYKVVTMIYKNQYIRIFAKIGDWYVIQTEGDFIGMANSKYVKLIYPTKSTNNTNGQNNSSTVKSEELTKDEEETFNLVNKERTAQGLTALKIDSELQNVARVKAQDLVENNYFSHTSPTYGSPFDMMKSFGITYKYAGENIAGNSSNSAAVKAWMNSEGHRANILNSNYNYTGLAVVSSPKYGKVYVQMFIGK